MIVAMATFAMSALAAVAPDSTGMTMDAQTWCQSVKAGWNLGNSLESAGGSWDNSSWTWTNVWEADRNKWETCWGNPATTASMIKAVKEAGFNAIRIPTRWEGHITDYDQMTIDPKWLARVKEVVDYAINLDMLVVLNTHHESWLENNPTYQYQNTINYRLTKIWTQIANTFIDYDDRLAFAGINEVQINWAQPTAENAAVQNSYNQTFVDAVRATGGRNYYRNLVVQTYSCNPYYGLNYLVVPTDVVEGRLAVEFHYYDPYEYCGSGQYYYWGKEYSSYGSTPSSNENTMKNLFTQAQQLWWKQGLGVVIGEYGVTNHYQENASKTEQNVQFENQEYWYKTLVSTARMNGFATFVWDNNAFGNGTEKFGIFNRKSNMRVDNTYSLRGIIEGSGQEYVEPQGGGGDTGDDVYSKVGTTLWSGSGYMAWGDGLQLSLPASNFTNIEAGDLLVLYYDIDGAAGYSMVQFFDGTWAKNPQFTYGGATSHEFNLRDITGQFSGAQITPFEIPAASIDLLKTSGLIIQGFGATLTKVVLVDVSEAGIRQIVTDPTDGTIYNLMGQKVDHMTRGNVYVINGQKTLCK
jgi:endoglucanase